MPKSRVKRANQKKRAIQLKTRHLIAEGKKPAVAYAEANAMAAKGRLGVRGGYKRAASKKRSR